MTEDRAPYDLGDTPDETTAARERLERDIESLIAAFIARTGATVSAVHFSKDDPTVRIFLEGGPSLRTVK